MIANISYEEAIALIGHTKGTHLYEVTDALVRAGVKVESQSKFERFPIRPDVKTALVRVRQTSGWRSHWQVWHNGEVYDPCPGGVCHWPTVSYLAVEAKS